MSAADRLAAVGFWIYYSVLRIAAPAGVDRCLRQPVYLLSIYCETSRKYILYLYGIEDLLSCTSREMIPRTMFLLNVLPRVDCSII